MPRVSIQQTNFTAGEISPRVAARTDIDRYVNAARRLLNAHPVVHGGAKRRAGSRFVGPAKYGDGSGGSGGGSGEITGDVILYCPFDGADGDHATPDLSPFARSLSMDNTLKISSDRAKFGSTSLKVTSTYSGANPIQVAGPEFGFGVGQAYTISLWVYHQATYNATSAPVICHWLSDTGTLCMVANYGSTSKGYYDNEGFGQAMTEQPYASGAWVHMAVAYDGAPALGGTNTLRYFIDGHKQFEGAVAHTGSSGTFRIGSPHPPGTWPNAEGADAYYIDDLCVIKAQALWTADFTPPTGPLLTGLPGFAGGATRLVPFIYSRDAAYMVEFGHLYARVHEAGGAAMVAELATPYTGAMLAELDYSQSSDTMFLFHPDVPIQRLRRLTPGSFDLAAAPFTVTPFDEQGHVPATGLTLSAATVGTGRTATAGAATFLPSDVGRQIVAGPGAAVVTAWTDSTHVTVTISSAFTGTSIAAGAWLLDLSPQGFATPTATGPVGGTVDLRGSLSRAADIVLSAKTGAGVTVTATSAVFTAGDVGKKLFAGGGDADITGYTDSTHVTVNVVEDFEAYGYASGGYGISAGVWRLTDVGSYVRINGGVLQITSFSADFTVKAKVVAELDSIVTAPALSWSLETPSWSAANGYPRTGTFHEQRLVVGGSAKYPQTIWGTRIADYLDFTKGTADDDGFSFTIAADEINPISYLASLRNLVAHTYGGEFSLQGGVEKPITPTNVRIRPESAHGSRGVRPVTVGKESVFVQRAGRKVRAMGYRYDFDGYSSPDLTVLAEHITKTGVAAMSYQQEPDMLLWAVRGDGAMLSCTLDRDQSVTAWARHVTDGVIESVGSIPHGDREEVWLLVRRTIDGQEVRYIEILEEEWQPLLQQAGPPVVYGFTVDAGLAFDSEEGQTVFSVPHLVGKTVDIVADGRPQPRQAVDESGQVTLMRPSYRTLIGLPFRTEIALLTPEVGSGTGTAQGNAMRTGEVTLRFLDTLGAKVIDGDGNAETVPFRGLGSSVLDQPPLPFTGLMSLNVNGWDRGRSELTVVQDQPLPLHLLGVIRKFTVND